MLLSTKESEMEIQIENLLSQSLFWWNVVVYGYKGQIKKITNSVAILVLVECCCLLGIDDLLKATAKMSQSLFWWNVVVYTVANVLLRLANQ